MDFYLTLPSNVHNDTTLAKKMTKEMWDAKRKHQELEEIVKQSEENVNKAEQLVIDQLFRKDKWAGIANKIKIKLSNASSEPTDQELDQFKKAKKHLDKDIEKAIELDRIASKRRQDFEQNNEQLQKAAENIISTGIKLDAVLESVNENKTNDFRVQLPYPIKLTGGDWELGLVEINYPRSWNNINKTGEELVTLIFSTQYTTSSKSQSQHEKITMAIPCGYYDTIEKLIEALNTEMEPKRKDIADWVQFSYSPILQRVSIYVKEKKLKTVILSQHLKYMLGFDERDVDEFEPGTTQARFPPDLRAGIDSLYVYCDLVEPQIVGNVRVPLLRTVPVTGSYGQMVAKIFHTPHYSQLQQNTFSSIHININTDTNVPLPFQFGKTVIKIHFRKRKRYGF